MKITKLQVKAVGVGMLMLIIARLFGLIGFTILGLIIGLIDYKWPFYAKWMRN
jgi:hypothetical protein